MKKRTYLPLLLIWFVVNAVSFPAFTAPSQLCEQQLLSTQSDFDLIRKSEKPVVVVHGQMRAVLGNATWNELERSLRLVGDRPGVLEFDVQVTKDFQFILLHDPTFHRSVRNYRTSEEKRQEFEQTYPDLAAQKRADWDYSLFDEVFSYSARDIKKNFFIFDPVTQQNTEVVSLAEVFGALKNPRGFTTPSYHFALGENSNQLIVQPARTVRGPFPLLYDVDFKPLENLAMRLYGKGDWHWIRASWSTEKLTAFTAQILRSFSALVSAYQMENNLFIIVRHPEVARLVREINPRIKIMASPGNITRESSDEDVVAAFEPFWQYHPELAELRFFRHLRSGRVESELIKREAVFFFNQIKQCDASQFEGEYQDDLPHLWSDIIKGAGNRKSAPILIQTNTPGELGGYLGDFY